MMFSVPALATAAFLALVALASPNPVQVGVGRYPTAWADSACRMFPHVSRDF